MGEKQVVFLCLVTVGLVASLFDDCDVVEHQIIAIQNCTTALQNVSKVDGNCPMSEFVIEIAVCEDVQIQVCHQVAERDLEANCMTFPTQHCVTSYETSSVPTVEVRRRAAEDTCEIKKATCVNGGVVAPQNVTCNYVF